MTLDDMVIDEELDLRDTNAQEVIGRLLCHHMLDMQMSDKETLAILIDEEMRTVTLKWEGAGEA